MADAFAACAFFYARGAGPAAGSGPLARDGVRHFAREAGSGTLARDGVRHLCLRWGLTPSVRDGGISALALYSALFYNSWCWWQHKYSIRW